MVYSAIPSPSIMSAHPQGAQHDNAYDHNGQAYYQDEQQGYYDQNNPQHYDQHQQHGGQEPYYDDQQQYVFCTF